MSSSNRRIEQSEIRDALTHAHALESIDRQLGDELIAAAREIVRAWDEAEGHRARLTLAVSRLRKLVGP